MGAIIGKLRRYLVGIGSGQKVPLSASNRDNRSKTTHLIYELRNRLTKTLDYVTFQESQDKP
jgi:hypothetical protein